MGNVSEIKIVPMNATFGEDVAQIQKISAVADVAGSLGGKYFFLFSALNTIKNYVWFDTGSSIDPAPAGFTGIHVTIGSGDSAAAVALAAKTVIDATTQYIATVSGNEITITNNTAGYAAAAYDAASPDATGFAFQLQTQGDQALDVGYVEGNIEVTVDPKTLEIKAHQTGEDLLDERITGKTVEVKMTFKESSQANLKKIITVLGGSYFPVSASTKEIIGMGTSKNGVSTFGLAKKLTLHPVALNASDKSQDYTFWKAFAKPESLTFSGTELFNLPVTFKIYNDSSKPAAISSFAYGDVTGV